MRDVRQMAITCHRVCATEPQQLAFWVCPEDREPSTPEDRVNLSEPSTCQLKNSVSTRGYGGVRASISVLPKRVVRERTPGPSCPQNPAGGLSVCSGWS